MEVLSHWLQTEPWQWLKKNDFIQLVGCWLFKESQGFVLKRHLSTNGLQKQLQPSVCLTETFFWFFLHPGDTSTFLSPVSRDSLICPLGSLDLVSSGNSNNQLTESNNNQTSTNNKNQSRDKRLEMNTDDSMCKSVFYMLCLAAVWCLYSCVCCILLVTAVLKGLGRGKEVNVQAISTKDIHCLSASPPV